MPTDQHPQSGRRQHFHRNRRGHDRRGERRPQGASPQPQESGQSGEHVDVDQIIRDIKARISQRHGIDLSTQQIQELAARRLEAILDPRTIKPGLIDQLRKAAGAPAGIAPVEPEDAYTFEDHTIYDTHNGLLRFIRRLLAPILKLFFNPNPISAALNAQVRINRETARREAERERTQAEWNALHYTMLQRLVTEVSRVSLEMQSLALRAESLAARADFTERRIRGIETPPAAAPQPSARIADVPAGGQTARPAGESAGAEGSGDGARRRRRRRRGRRGSAPGGEAMSGAPASSPAGVDAAEADDESFDDGPDSDSGEPDGGEEADAARPLASMPLPVEPPALPLAGGVESPRPDTGAGEPSPSAPPMTSAPEPPAPQAQAPDHERPHPSAGAPPAAEPSDA